MSSCIFCDIISKSSPAYIVHEDEHTLTFLDKRPLFPGHCLLVPKQHIETLPELPEELVNQVFNTAKMLSAAVKLACQSQGTFVALNNTVSQSVPHLHVHIVPRTKGDGLKGFFWPRNPYKDEEHMIETANMLIAAIQKTRESYNLE